MIPDEDIEAAVDWLRDSAGACATAKADRIYCGEYRKSLKAIIASECNEKSESARERFAYASERYQEHLKALRAAVLEDEKNCALRVAAEMKIEAWRTMSSNIRSIKL